ncbi:ArnT family glycosyltransferase [Maribacter sp. MAR_2009_72]|uniref:ArnT family glycosyltransferase n=1 Tax=Maribacter sp. MAR_2009_72 TaxID=1250050 RepID=UPI00119A4E96|nr:glycosyltransferase family 39 protein [Maribacter sp. MAR_2009_72]TVZ15830.1 dolichyl-phosphate-mannose-protein mannosyltransferase [Maribacter sp. MAR_2009_72]
MSLKRNENVFYTISKWKNSTILLFFFCITFFIRFPFFFRDYIDRDESTFILLGQSWANGFLPYTQLWDLKPPLTFAFFASIITLFGKSFIAIRLAGVFTVLITAFFTFKIARTILAKTSSIIVAVSCIVLLSLFGSLQGVMSEHICVAFFVPAIYLILKKKSAFAIFFAGLLMGITVMVKLNMAFPICFIGLFLLYEALLTKKKKGFLKVILFGIGILTVILATIVPYYITGQTLVWWKSVILAPLEYTEARRYSFLKLAPIFVIIGLFLIYAYKNKYIDFKNRTNQLLLVSIFGILISFIKGGRINGHYLIQLHPLFLILLGIVISNILLRYKPRIPVFLAFVGMLIPAESYLEYINVAKNYYEKNTLYNGEGFSVPQYITDHNLETKNILFFEYHIGYWNLNTLPPTIAATHPSNICRDELFPFFNNPRKIAIEELQYIMEVIRPKTVITRKSKRIFDKKLIEVNTYIDDYLSTHYVKLADVENAEVLQRLERP